MEGEFSNRYQTLATLFLVLMVFALVTYLVVPATATTDPVTGRVRILYIGDGVGDSPVPHFHSDPAFTILSILAFSAAYAGYDIGPEESMHVTLRRIVRQYMPRTLGKLVDKYDVIVLSEAEPIFMEAKHMSWFRDSVAKHGLGLVMIGGPDSFGAIEFGGEWTSIEDIFPVSMEPSWLQGNFRVRPAIDHPFTKSLPWSTMPPFFGINLVSLRPGVVLLLTTTDEQPYPHLSYWSYGKGRTVAHATDWTPIGGSLVMKWEYYPDYVANIAYLTSQNNIPQDAELLHQLRIGFWLSRNRKISVIDIMEWAEKFGARTAEIERGLGELSTMISNAESFYIRQEYEKSLESIVEIEDYVDELQRQTIRIKDRALVWIYVIEWTAISSTALLTGFVLWTLMVRRHLYHEAKATRFIDLSY